MAFSDIFKDENTINEKSVVGFAAFAMMVIFGVVDILTGLIFLLVCFDVVTSE